ncbi:hypothetical protein M422DRAFT_253992 [Sphaerobolus stellatus SS14]|uniref:Uncharacterized protein n=1 Tax=Sphaerobolus stellatus (strain SS14) TaxID=990650 RepID=A0A0C9VWY8_SPHS4|nr:hypothetical protein M422DRAFT_253992 [Sphaerobolus stellatus SS14]
MAPKKKTVDKVPAGTGDAADSGSTSNVIGGNDPTLDPGKDPSQAVSAASEMNTSPTTRSTRVTDQLAQPASEQGTSEDPTQTPNPHRGSRDPLLPKTYSDYSEPSERSASANPDPEELALGDQIQEMLNTINEHMDEVKSIHNMSRQAAQLLVKTNESNSALEARTRTLRTQLIVIREKYPTIAKGKLSIVKTMSLRCVHYSHLCNDCLQCDSSTWTPTMLAEFRESSSGSPILQHNISQSIELLSPSSVTGPQTSWHEKSVLIKDHLMEGSQSESDGSGYESDRTSSDAEEHLDGEEIVTEDPWSHIPPPVTFCTITLRQCRKIDPQIPTIPSFFNLLGIECQSPSPSSCSSSDSYAPSSFESDEDDTSSTSSYTM